MGYAARIAVENQPVSEWRGRVLQESNPKALVAELLALARQGESSDQDSIFEGLGRLDPEAISEQEVLSSYLAPK